MLAWLYLTWPATESCFEDSRSGGMQKSHTSLHGRATLGLSEAYVARVYRCGILLGATRDVFCAAINHADVLERT
jgi:hypothetical protein